MTTPEIKYPLHLGAYDDLTLFIADTNNMIVAHNIETKELGNLIVKLVNKWYWRIEAYEREDYPDDI